MLYIIDGYNLLYKLGYGGQGQQSSWEKRRENFLDYLALSTKNSQDDFYVLFDAQKVSGSKQELPHKNLTVYFTTGLTADDWIEANINSISQPQFVTIVSDDHRWRQAAERRGCIYRNDDQLLDAISNRSPKPGSRRQFGDEKIAMSKEELSDLLKEFEK